MLQYNLNLVGVVTKKKSNYNSDHFDLSRIIKHKNISILDTKDINKKKNIQWLKRKKPDLIFCIGWSQILNKSILTIPKKGVIGFHPSNLPENKGKHPLIWTLALGLKKSYSTFFFMNSQIDDGRIINKKSFFIDKKDTAQNLYYKTIRVAEKQIHLICRSLIKDKKLFSKKQVGKSNIWRKRSFKDGVIDWRMSAETINNLTRALSHPYSNASFFYKSKKYDVIKSKIVKNNNLNIEPGKVVMQSSSGFIIKCGIDSIKVIRSKPDLKFDLTKREIYLD